MSIKRLKASHLFRMTIHRGPKRKLQAILTIHTRTLVAHKHHQISETFTCKTLVSNYAIACKLLNSTSY